MRNDPQELGYLNTRTPPPLAVLFGEGEAAQHFQKGQALSLYRLTLFPVPSLCFVLLAAPVATPVMCGSASLLWWTLISLES